MTSHVGSQSIPQRSVPSVSRATNVRNPVARRQPVHPGTHERDHLVPLPDGGGFLLPCTNDLFGPGYAFRMTSSSESGDNVGFGIVPYQPPQPPVVSEKGRMEARVIVYQGGRCNADFEQSEADRNVPAGLLPQPSIAGVLPGPSEEGITHQSKLRAQDRLVVGRESGSPRRSLKLQFTCNRCQTRNVATVNPLAWRYGTVFIECGGCKVKHKMVDHLNVAEEVGITAGEMDLTQKERMREMMSDVKLQVPE